MIPNTQAKYHQTSQFEQKQSTFQFPGFTTIVIIILNFLSILALINIQYVPRIIESKGHFNNKIINYNVITLEILSKELLTYDNALIASIDSEFVQLSSNIQLNGRQIQLTICNETLHKRICATQEQIDSIFSNPIMAQINVQITQYDFESENFNSFWVKQIIYIHKSTQQLIDITLKVTTTSIDHLLNNHIIQQSISDYNLQTQSLSIQNNTLAVININLDNIQSFKIIKYDKFQLIIINIGSISFLFWILYKFIKSIQYIKQRKQILFSIISIYFPQLTQYKIKFNVFGQISQVSTLNNEKKNIQLFRTFFKKYINIAQEKTSILNLIYTISRLQYICQSIQDRDTIQNVHQIGIKLSMQNDIQNETSVTQMTEWDDDPQILKPSDIELLNQPKRPIITNGSINPFYRKNVCKQVI